MDLDKALANEDAWVQTLVNAEPDGIQVAAMKKRRIGNEEFYWVCVEAQFVDRKRRVIERGRAEVIIDYRTEMTIAEIESQAIVRARSIFRNAIDARIARFNIQD